VKINDKPKPKQQHDRPIRNHPVGKQEGNRDTIPLSKIYESPKFMLRRSLEVIEVAVQDQLDTLFDDYTKWRRGNAKKPEYIFNMLLDFAFAAVLPKIVKQNFDFILERGEEFSELLSSAVSELSKRNPQLTKAKEMIAIYSTIYEDLNERRIKKVFKLEIPGVEWAGALKLCIVSHGSAGHTMNNTLRAIYTTLKTTSYDVIRKLFIKLYGKHDLGRVAIHILLERGYDKQKNSWINRELYDMITNLALNELERLPQKEIKSLLALYCNERRKSEFEQFTRRRVNFSMIDSDDYEKITKAVKKLAKKNDMYRSFLDQGHITKKKG